jgi:hypothetical protein
MQSQHLFLSREVAAVLQAMQHRQQYTAGGFRTCLSTPGTASLVVLKQAAVVQASSCFTASAAAGGAQQGQGVRYLGMQPVAGMEHSRSLAL